MVRSGPWTLLLLISCTALIPVSLRSQETMEEVPRRILLFYEGKAGLSRAEAALLYESLLIGIEEAAPEVVLLENQKNPSPDTDEKLTETARQAEADAWIAVEVAGPPPRLSMRARSMDLISRRRVIEVSFRNEQGLSLGELVKVAWADLAVKVQESYPKVLSRVFREKASFASLRLKALPGTLIHGLDPKALTVGESGFLELRLPAPASYTFTARRPGAVTTTRTLFLEAGVREVSLEQEPSVRFIAGLGLHHLSFPSLEASWYPVPGWLFLRLGFSSYALGLLFLNEKDVGDRSLLVSENLGLLWASLGGFFLEEDSPWRIGLEARGFLRVRFGADSPIGLDGASPWGFQPLLVLEHARVREWGFFLEYGPLIYWTDDIRRLRSDFPLEHGTIGVLLKEPLTVDFFCVSAGFRRRF